MIMLVAAEEHTDVVRFIDNWLKENDPMSKYSKRYGFFMIKERFALYFSKFYSVRHGMRFVLLPLTLFAFKPRN